MSHGENKNNLEMLLIWNRTPEIETKLAKDKKQTNKLLVPYLSTINIFYQQTHPKIA